MRLIRTASVQYIFNNISSPFETNRAITTYIIFIFGTGLHDHGRTYLFLYTSVKICLHCVVTMWVQKESFYFTDVHDSDPPY